MGIDWLVCFAPYPESEKTLTVYLLAREFEYNMNVPNHRKEKEK